MILLYLFAFRIQLFSLAKQPIREKGFLQSILMADTQNKDETGQVKVINHVKSCCLATCHAGKTAEPPQGRLNDIIVTNRLSNELVVNRYCGMLLLDAEHEKHPFNFPPHSFDSVATGNGYDTEVVLVDTKSNLLALGKLSFETSLWSFKLRPTPVIKIHKIKRDVMTGPRGNQNEDHGMSYVAIDTENQTIFMADYHGHCVKVFGYNRAKMHGPIREMNNIGSYGGGCGELKYPCGVTIDTENKFILVADSGNHRISAFGYNGVFKDHILTARDGVNNPRGVSYNPTNKLLAVTMFSQGLLSHNSQVAVYEEKQIVDDTRKSCFIS